MFDFLKRKKPQLPAGTPPPTPPPGGHPQYYPYLPPPPPPKRKHGFGWGKTAGIAFTVALPGGLLIYANQQVFPDSAWLATGMVIVSIGVAIIFAVASGYATPKVKKYVLVAAVVLAVELSANLACHWVLSREVSGAKQATVARHEEEDREEDRKDREAKRQKEFLDAQRGVLQADARRLAQLPVEQRRSAIRPQSARSQPPDSAITAVPASVTAPKLTVEQVMEKWLGWLILFAILDLLTSVVAFGICALAWEWDRNHDGIDDRLQPPYGQYPPYDQYVPPGSYPYPTDPRAGPPPDLTRRAPGFVQASSDQDPK